MGLDHAQRDRFRPTASPLEDLHLVGCGKLDEGAVGLDARDPPLDERLLGHTGRSSDHEPSRDPGLRVAERLSKLPGRVFSGKAHPKADSKAVFFCYALPVPEARPRDEREGTLFAPPVENSNGGSGWIVDGTGNPRYRGDMDDPRGGVRHVIAIRFQAPSALWAVPAVLPLLPGLQIVEALLAPGDAARVIGLVGAAGTAFLIGAGVASGDIVVTAVRRMHARVTPAIDTVTTGIGVNVVAPVDRYVRERAGSVFVSHDGGDEP